MGLRNRLMPIALATVTAGLLVFFSVSSFTQPWREHLLLRSTAVLGAAGRVSAWLAGKLGGVSEAKLREWEEERIRLLGELARREGVLRENEVLRAALALRREGEEGVLTAAVLGVLREGREELLLLNRGARDGIGVGDLVLSRARVLGGTVVEVGPRVSRVLLLPSASQSIDVLIAGTSLRAIARGNNNRELIVDLVPQGSPLQPGDLIVASGRATGGRKSFLVGEVREVRQAENEVFKTVRAIHLFDPGEEEVLVLPAP